MELPNLAKLRIVFYPDPILRERCRPIEAFEPGLTELAERMLELMRAGEGVGLAGPQVGLPLRLFVCNPTGDPADDRVFFNPQLSEFDGAAEADEGCLSLPEVSVIMRRATRVVIEALDRKGEPIRETGENLHARIWQHETDHLDGRLIIDRMSTADEIANRRTLKQLTQDYEGRGKKGGRGLLSRRR